MTAQLHLEPRIVRDDTLELAATFKLGADRQRLWWRVPAQWESAVTDWADPFVVGLLFPMMQAGGPVMIEGNVSPSLLRNLETFASIWCAWFPGRYKMPRISARNEIEPLPPQRPDQTILPFSCGVDSCFTLLRHQHGLRGRRNRTIGAALVMHGFDIWLDQENATAMYQGLATGAGAMLESIAVPCIGVSSNFHELPTIWADSFGTHLVSRLMLFSKYFGGTLIPNNIPYTQLGIWGSTPVSDPFMGSASFPVLDDGGECTRFEKIELISRWPQTMKHLRVCYSNPGNHANCGKCEKCIRTMLAFRIAGTARPEAFACDPTDRQIARVKFHYEMNRRLWLELIDGLPTRGLKKTSWARAMRAAARPSPWPALKRPFIPLRNQIRKLFRGSTKSRRELQKARSSQGPAQRMMR